MSVDFRTISGALEQWYARPGGQHLLAHELQMATQALDKAFGYHLLQLGITRDAALPAPDTLHHAIYAAAAEGGQVSLHTDLDALPFPADSIDAIVLHHALEFSDNPHQLLREVHRVLSPQGHLIVIGFNPLSGFGISTALRGLRPASLWHSMRALTSHRLRDWLHLLGCEVINTRHTFAFPPLGSGRLLAACSAIDSFLHRHKWPLGGVYVVHAQKKVVPLNPVGKPWQRRLGRNLLGVPKPVPSPCEVDSAA